MIENVLNFLEQKMELVQLVKAIKLGKARRKVHDLTRYSRSAWRGEGFDFNFLSQRTENLSDR